ncbi:MAG: hypothetical protein VBE63_28885, partial [Lamprobacter sp.]|uniref:hypothetical protein n=1 Tax=Lamprobacter sp. TaxID=3100796 RepID=UPI002B259EFB
MSSISIIYATSCRTDPKNDYVFFRIFSEAPELLLDLINAVRSHEPPIVEVSLLDARLSPERLSAWIAYFEHWQEETLMSSLSHPPVQKAIGKLRAMSADEEERYWAEARDKALRDEVTLLAVAREEGIELGREQATRETARNLIQLG